MGGTAEAQIERAFFFDNTGERLFGVLHIPRTQGRKAGLVFCAPFGQEKYTTHRLFVDFGRRLCGQGFYVLRFDYRGIADSEGEPENATLASQVSDIRRAVDLMAVECGVEEVGLLGLRLGATLAALEAADDARVKLLVLWAPLVSPKGYFAGLLRKELISSAMKNRSAAREALANALEAGSIEIDGYPMSAAAYSEYLEVDLTEQFWRFEGELLVMDVTHDARRYDPAIRRLAETWQARDIVAEYRVIEEPPFWTGAGMNSLVFPARLCDETLRWLREKLGS